MILTLRFVIGDVSVCCHVAEVLYLVGILLRGIWRGFIQIVDDSAKFIKQSHKICVLVCNNFWISFLVECFYLKIMA